MRIRVVIYSSRLGRFKNHKYQHTCSTSHITPVKAAIGQARKTSTNIQHSELQQDERAFPIVVSM
jgi:hypothetical protein